VIKLGINFAGVHVSRLVTAETKVIARLLSRPRDGIGGEIALPTYTMTGCAAMGREGRHPGRISRLRSRRQPMFTASPATRSETALVVKATGACRFRVPLSV
jgi:hypothetical protein